MKFLLTVLLFLVLISPAWATHLAYATNGAGGRIVLTDSKPKKCAGKPAAFAASREGVVVFGCWFLSDDYVFIHWLEDNDSTAYPLSSFRLYKTYKANGRSIHQQKADALQEPL